MPVGERRLLEPSELWPQEQQLCVKAAEGRLLDLRCRRRGEDNPARGREWSPQRRIRAQVVFQLLTGHGPKLADSVVAVRLRGAQIVGRLNLGGQKLRCPLELNQCHVGHPLDLAKAEAPNVSLRGSHLQFRLSARQLRVAHTVNLSGSRCEGRVALPAAHISGQLFCVEAVFTNPDGEALGADGLVVDGHMSLRKAQCTGEVRLVYARIGGGLDCDEAVFSNPDGEALVAEGLVVDGNMFLRRAQCTGEVVLGGAHISSELHCTEAVFSNPGGDALIANWMVVGGGMFLDKVQSTGSIRLHGAHIPKGVLDCSEAVFSNPTGDALVAIRLIVDSDMFLNKVNCAGAVRLFGVHISGILDCSEAVFSNPAGLAIDLERATVEQSVQMYPASLEGGLNLSHARVGAWNDEKRTWPGLIRLEGFVYDSIHAADASVRDRLRSWLPRTRTRYLPQPYEQLAKVYRQNGNEQAAHTVAIGKQRARRAAVRRSAWLPSVMWSATLRWTIGYGYRPVRALIPLAVLALIGSVLFLFASQHPDPLHPVLHPTKPGSPEQPAFNSFRYTMDLLLPVVNFKQRDSFVAEGWAAWASFGFTFAGWLLAAIVVAGLTGVFKRD